MCAESELRVKGKSEYFWVAYCWNECVIDSEVELCAIFGRVRCEKSGSTFCCIELVLCGPGMYCLEVRSKDLCSGVIVFVGG